MKNSEYPIRIFRKIYNILVAWLVIIFLSDSLYAENTGENNKNTVSGTITNASNGEALIGATIFVKELKTGTSTNKYGYYAINLPPGTYTLEYSYIGFEKKTLEIDLEEDITQNIELRSKEETLDEVVVKGEKKDANVRKNEMSVSKLDAETISKIPAMMGETDLIKAIQLLPGVQFATEGSSGFTVRGGSPDQNLILLDEAPVYNASHLMGFFSVFNNDAIKDVKLYKGNIPARAGGSLSSLLDIRMKEGNQKELSGQGGIGTISSRLTLEGPLAEDRASFLVAGRRSYADLFLPLANDENVSDNTLYFYDLNAKVNYKINENNRLFLSGYYGRDVFKNQDFRVGWGNNTFTVRWNHLFSKKLFSNFTFVKSNYDYNLGIPEGEPNSFIWKADLNDYTFKGDFSYYPNPQSTFKFGIQSTYHRFFPGTAKGLGEQSLFNAYEVHHNNSLESSLYFEHEYEFNPLLSLRYGLRYTLFQNVGSGIIYNFNDNYEVTDSTKYDSGEFFNNYDGFEPRIGLRYQLNEFSSIKASYSRTKQYIHRATNSTSGTPLDIWFPSTPNIEPQKADQWALGYFRNFRGNTIETSLEVFYKNMYDIVDFKDHAEILLNKEYEGEIRSGDATAYGAEFMTKFDINRFNGRVSYTYSHSERTVKTVNDGETYLSPYDRPHNITIVLNADITKRLSTGLNWVYMTGRPVTFPTGRVEIGGKYVPVYSERNGYRMPDYHRMDFSLTYKGEESGGKKFHSEWSLSLYNAYGRKNAWVINFVQDEQNPSETYAEKTYLFGVVPSITYNFYF